MKNDRTKRVKPVTILWRGNFGDGDADVDVLTTLSVNEVKFALGMIERTLKQKKHGHMFAEVMWVHDMSGTHQGFSTKAIRDADITLDNGEKFEPYKMGWEHAGVGFEEADFDDGDVELTSGLLFTDGRQVWVQASAAVGPTMDSDFIPVRRFKAAAYAKPEKPRALRKSEKVKLDRRVQVMQQLRVCQQK